MKDILGGLTDLNTTPNVTGFAFDRKDELMYLLPWLKNRTIHDAYFYTINDSRVLSNWGYMLELLEKSTSDLSKEEIELMEQARENLMFPLDPALLKLLDTIVVSSATNLNWIHN